MDDISWRNEISSYKCGEKVGIRLCIEPQNGAALCNPNDSESGLPSSKNEEIEYNDLVEHVQIMPQSPYGATIFAKPGCKGKSAVIKADNSIAGSWTTYDDNSNTLLESGNVMSVIVHEEVEVDFFSNGNFIGNSFASRNHLGRSDECVELAFLSEYFGGKDHLTDSNRVEGDTNIHAAWAHI